MDLYTKTAYVQSKLLTNAYSTSFGSATTLFPRAMRPHIYAVYGLVRIADEIVDTYKGPDAAKLLSALESDTYEAISRGYSVNPLIHAFAITCRAFSITKELIEPFFASMAVDIAPPKHFSAAAYKTYIYGSAEVVGLMCLRIFVNGNETEYRKLAEGAKRLGAAYQKVNFLRDFAADYTELQRIYFPNVPDYPLREQQKNEIISDIQEDFVAAERSLQKLPTSAKSAVSLSRDYYRALLAKLDNTSAEVISTQRIRISDAYKARLLAKSTAVKLSAKVRHS